MHYKYRVPPNLYELGNKNFFRSLRSRIHYFVPPIMELVALTQLQQLEMVTLRYDTIQDFNFDS